jgi:hypothetical protein
MMPGKMTFDQWMRDVDQAVSRLAYLSVYDLTDQPFADWFEAGVRPLTAAKRAIRNNGD